MSVEKPNVGDPKSPPLSEGQRERIKLTAVYFNGIAIGLVLVGGLSLPATIALNAKGTFDILIAVALNLFSVIVSPLYALCCEASFEEARQLMDYLLYAAAALTLPVSALVITFIVTRQLDREIDCEQFEKLERRHEAAR